jgi:hypothetical protein
MTLASIIGLVSIGVRAGQRMRRILLDPAETVKIGPLCFASRGFSFHAAKRITAGNRHGLENLCNHTQEEFILRVTPILRRMLHAPPKQKLIYLVGLFGHFFIFRGIFAIKTNGLFSGKKI